MTKGIWVFRDRAVIRGTAPTSIPANLLVSAGIPSERYFVTEANSSGSVSKRYLSKKYLLFFPELRSKSPVRYAVATSSFPSPPKADLSFSMITNSTRLTPEEKYIYGPHVGVTRRVTPYKPCQTMPQ